ncbi:MAG: hypothetical protein PF517_18470 [Salinivirgaceae bacterium]|jgi:hypothetical protein|nr:hypothetical protein [Salinivirgaceae bacterium]
MTYQEKRSIVNIFSGLIIAIIYGLFVFHRHQQGRFDLTLDYKVWGIIFLIFIGVSIIARIIIYIIFHIINTITTKEVEIPISDEREKMINLKARSNAYHTFSLSFIAAFVLLAMGKPFYWMFIVFIISGILSEIVENTSQIYYHRKGI